MMEPGAFNATAAAVDNSTSGSGSNSTKMAQSVSSGRKSISSFSTSGSSTYRDHSHITDEDASLKQLVEKADTEGVKGTDQTFPVKLHQLLSGSDEDGFSHIVCWQPHGRSFIVKKHSEFVDKVLPCCFRQSKFASFQRQLNLYGFRRITQGKDKGGYYHELFLRGRNLLALKMQRTKVKGTGARKPSSPETEPDFYAMPFVYETKKSAPSPQGTKPAVAVPAASMVSPALASLEPPKASFATFSPSNLPNRKMFPAGNTLASLGSTSPSRTFRGGMMSMFPAVVSRPNLTDRMAAADRLLLSAATSHASNSAFLARGNSSSNNNNMNHTKSLRDAAALNHLARRGNSSLAGGGGSWDLPSSSPTFAAGNFGNRLAGTGPLHLNALNMPCNCAIPAF